MTLSSVWSATFTQLRRDAAYVRRRLAGERASPVRITRTSPIPPASPIGSAASISSALSIASAAAIASIAPTAQAPREVRVARVVRETHDVTTLVLDDDTRGEPIAFDAGQFFTLLAELESGAIVPRNYSASNAPGTTELHLTIKKKPGGQVSGGLSALGVGARVRLLGPFGTFTPGPRADGRHVVLFAGGVGITPLLAILRVVLATEPTSVVTLIYGNRSERDIAFASTLDELATAHEGRLTIEHVLEAPEASRPALCEQRLDRSTVGRLLDALPDATGREAYFVCGPDAMQREVLAALSARGIDDARIRSERFEVGGRRAIDALRPRPSAADAASSMRRLTILSASGVVVTTTRAGMSLLEAGLAADVPMPFSCSVGGCGACRVRVIEGDVDLDEPHCLSDEEREAGYVLACVGRARGACTIEVTTEDER